MGTARSKSLVLSVAMLLLAGPAVLAQPGADAGPDPEIRAAVAVQGTSTLVGEADPGTTTLDGDVVRVRDNVLLTLEQSTDPRASGRARITVNIDAYPDAAGLAGASQVRYGRMRLVSEDGAWVGRFAGSMANGGFVQTYWLRGEGAFTGWSYVVTAGGNGQVWRSQGLIFPGELPPLGAGARLPVDAIERELPTTWAVDR